MRFSNKQIFNGDTKDVILEKANENFSQIISFSSGPMGRPGVVGPTGYPGSAGPFGPSGATGTRASEWTVSSTQPTSPNSYDQWINQGSTGNGEIYQYDGSSWQNTGISTVESEFFQIKASIPTFGASTNFSAIYLSGSDQENTYLVISDGNNPASSVNPNYSKLLISTSDQTANPVFSFRNTASSQITQPSFYWDQTGNSSKIKFSSDGGLIIYSSSTTSVSPQYSGVLNASGRNAYFKSIEDLSSQQMNLTSSGSLELNTSNYVLNATQMTANTETYVYGAVNVEPAYPVASKADGVVITKGVTSSFTTVSFSTTQFQSEIENPSFNPFRQVFNINQSTAVLDETDPITDVAYRDVRSRATFGATGDGYGIYDIWGSGIPTSPTGPFGYHVVANTTLSPQVGSFYIGRPTSANIRYYVDLSSTNNFYTDSITFSLPTTWAGGTSAYVKIPGYQSTPPSSSSYPLYGPDYVNEYKIFMDYGRFTSGTNQGIDKKIAGVVWDQLGNPPAGSSTPTITQQYLVFQRPCYFFEIVYHFNNSNQVVAFIKTCNGQSTPIQITNYTAKPPAQFSLVPGSSRL